MTDGEREVEALRSAHAAVIGRIASAADRAGRDPATITLVAVSKTVPAARIVHAARAGIRTLGENRVQEAQAKQPELSSLALVWHLVGPLQSNKARKAIDAFDVIQTVDSVDLARRLDGLLAGPGRTVDGDPSGRCPVLLQVNVDADPAKAGLSPDAVAAALVDVTALPNLRVEGLMTVGRLVATPDEARSTFRALRDLSARLRGQGLSLGPELSMGMSDDFEVAIEEGATIVRVGRAIFGERPHVHGDGPLDHRHHGRADGPAPVVG